MPPMRGGGLCACRIEWGGGAVEIRTGTPLLVTRTRYPFAYCLLPIADSDCEHPSPEVGLFDQVPHSAGGTSIDKNYIYVALAYAIDPTRMIDLQAPSLLPWITGTWLPTN